MPLWNWIECKAKSNGDTLLAHRKFAALTIALVAALSMLLVSDGRTVHVKTLTRFATDFCALTLTIAIFVHVIKSIGGMCSGKPITWNDTVLAVTTLLQTIYFVYVAFYVYFVDALAPYLFNITTSSDPNTVSQLRILVLTQYVFLTGFTYYWATMNRMVHVVKSLEETYRNPTEGTIGGSLLSYREDTRYLTASCVS